MDIITQLNSVIGAILRAEEKILRKHIEGCAIDALKGKSETEKQKKIDELLELVGKFRRS
ncbi:MAG: metal-sensing transcriptional repressor [Candidatus Omnitrophota bacterium]